MRMAGRRTLGPASAALKWLSWNSWSSPWKKVAKPILVVIRSNMPVSRLPSYTSSTVKMSLPSLCTEALLTSQIKLPSLQDRNVVHESKQVRWGCLLQFQPNWFGSGASLMSSWLVYEIGTSLDSISLMQLACQISTSEVHCCTRFHCLQSTSWVPDMLTIEETCKLLEAQLQWWYKLPTILPVRWSGKSQGARQQGLPRWPQRSLSCNESWMLTFSFQLRGTLSNIAAIELKCLLFYTMKLYLTNQ